MAEARFRLPVEPCAILQAEGWDKTVPAFEAELACQLGGALPAAVGDTAPIGGGWLAVRIAPRRLWLVGEEGADLPCTIGPALGALLWLGEGRLRLRLSGPHIFDILSACVAVDWQAAEAAPGRAVQTGFHHVPVLLIRTADHACDLLVPRSFAESLAEWVADIAAAHDGTHAMVAG